MTKAEVCAKIRELAIIPAVRAATHEGALFAAEAVSRGGLPIVELTMTVPKATELIAHLVKKTRDDAFIEKDEQGHTVNRCPAIAWSGGCTDTNEFNYLVVKTMRSLGVTYLENQARV